MYRDEFRRVPHVLPDLRMSSTVFLNSDASMFNCSNPMVCILDYLFMYAQLYKVPLEVGMLR